MKTNLSHSFKSCLWYLHLIQHLDLQAVQILSMQSCSWRSYVNFEKKKTLFVTETLDYKLCRQLCLETRSRFSNNKNMEILLLQTEHGQLYRFRKTSKVSLQSKGKKQQLQVHSTFISIFSFYLSVYSQACLVKQRLLHRVHTKTYHNEEYKIEMTSSKWLTKSNLYKSF